MILFSTSFFLPLGILLTLLCSSGSIRQDLSIAICPIVLSSLLCIASSWTFQFSHV